MVAEKDISSKESGSVIELGAGWAGKIRWQLSNGVVFKTDDSFTPSAVGKRWADINSYSKGTFPTSTNDVDMDVSVYTRALTLV